jgi:hypothetical protein
MGTGHVPEGGRARPTNHALRHHRRPPLRVGARSLARQHLHQIDAWIQRILTAKDQNLQIDAQTQAHLEEAHEQIDKVLKASLQANEV